MPRYTDRDPSASAYEVAGPSPVKNRNRWPWLLGGLVVLLLLGCVLMGALLAGSGPNNSGLGEAPTVAPSVTANPPVKSSVPAAKAKPKAVGVAEGGYYVGDDLPAGKYRTPGARREVITLCYWEVRTNGEPDGPIGQQGVTDKIDEPGNVTLRKGDYFKTTGCERWIKR